MGEAQEPVSDEAKYTVYLQANTAVCRVRSCFFFFNANPFVGFLEHPGTVRGENPGTGAEM